MFQSCLFIFTSFRYAEFYGYNFVLLAKKCVDKKGKGTTSGKMPSYPEDRDYDYRLVWSCLTPHSPPSPRFADG